MNITIQNVKIIVLLAALVALLVTGCANTEGESSQTTGADVAVQSATNLDTSPPISDAAGAVSAQSAQNVEITNEATVSSVDVLIMESFPVQVTVVINGTLPNSCTTIGQITQTRNGNEFIVAIGTIKQTEVMCAEQVEPFEENVSLDVLGLPAGSYSVVASGATSASNFFALDVDNTPPQIDPTPELVGASITGIVWQDTCDALSGDTTGCVEDETGNARGNGTFDSNEPRIPGVEVTLSSGNCSSESEAIGQAKTDSAGNYLFTSLRAGTYCVGVNPSSPANAPLLMPGKWTYPEVEVGSSTLQLAENDYQTADFGWDYQFDPPPEVAATPTPVPTGQEQTQGCLDAAAYVADVTIPDDTALAPGEAFVKTWRVSNQGTCTWDSGYSLIFNGGEQMGGPASVPLGQVVQPGAEVDVSVSLVAPSAPGSYSGDWLFQNPNGTTFGSRGDYPIYLQIVVSE